MKLVAGAINKVLLESLHSMHTPESNAIKVAVAYADNFFLDFLNRAAKHNVPLTFYGRYDESLPVKLPVIEWFLDNKWRQSMECLLVPDYYHPKIIWWQGRGVYIGSANLSKRAWFDNIEIGTFFSDEDIQRLEMHEQLEQIFQNIHERAVPINNDLRQSMKAMGEALKNREEAEEKYKQAFEKRRWIAKGDPLTIGTSLAGNRKLLEYQRMRHEIVARMETLGALLSAPDNRPYWMPADIPAFLQVDQFLYAYDEQFPQNKGRKAEEVAAANLPRHQQAVDDAVAWWRSGDYKIIQLEEQVVNVFPLVRERFGQMRLRQLTQAEFVEAFTKIHAVQERARNRSNEALGFGEDRIATAEMRRQRHAEQIFNQVSKGGKNVREMLEYVLWLDSIEPMDRRVYNGSYHEMWAMPEIRENTLSDLLGWVRPDAYPPINGRTIKALKKLGYKIEDDSHTEEGQP